MSLMRALIKQGIISKRVHKVRMLQQTITEGDASATNNFNLLTCDDEPNYDLTTDGTNVAECHPGAKIIAVQLHMTIYNVVGQRIIEWVIGRDPDASITAGSFSMANLYAADVSGTTLLVRKNTWGAGHMVASDRTAMDTKMNITKALRRAAKMRDGDIIRLHFTDDGTGAGNAQFYLRGRIITVGP